MNGDLLRPDWAWCNGLPAADMDASIAPYAERLQKLEAEERTRGVLLAEANPVKFLAAWLACMRADIPVILASPAWARRERATLATLFKPALSFGGLDLPEGPAVRFPRLSAGAVLIPTGGSRGSLRFAQHTKASLFAHWDGLASWCGGGPLHSLCVLPLHHVSGLMQAVRALASGGSVRFATPTDLYAGEYSGLPSRGDASMRCISLVSTQLKRLLERGGGERLRALFEIILLGGGPPDEPLLREAIAQRLPVYLTYGMTETASMVALARVSAAECARPLAGVVLAHANVRIIDAVGVDVASGEVGEIMLRAKSLFTAYYPPESGSAPDGAGWWRSGDRGYLNRDGEVKVLGRMDRIIITGGEKVDPAEVESELLHAAGVSEAVVFGIPDAEWGQAVVALVVIKLADVCIEDLLSKLSETLVGYKVPKRIKLVRSIPRNPLGKVDFAKAASILQKP